jgi:TorA maturation chaperone TorD
MEMQEGGVHQAIRAVGAIGSMAYAESLVSAGPMGGPAAPDTMSDAPLPADDVEALRAHEYSLLALLLCRAPTADLLEKLSELKGDASPLGLAHIALADAARDADPDAVIREYFDLFVGVGQGELLPFGSYYLTGFLHGRPLARLRQDLAGLGIEAAESLREPEDHIGILCEVMAGLAGRQFEAGAAAERRFFERHLEPWAARFFADLEGANLAKFYRAVGTVGRIFMAVESEAFAMDER